MVVRGNGWWLWLMAIGCAVEDADDGVAETSGDDDAVQTSGEGPGESSAESSGTSGPSLSHDEVEALCAVAATRAECESVAMGGSGTDLSWCTWERWRTATIDAGGTCTLGPIEESCGFQRGGDACATYSLSSCGAVTGSVGAWDGTRVGFAEGWCTAPGESCSVDDGVVAEGPPECACLCDPSWPEPQ